MTFLALLCIPAILVWILPWIPRVSLPIWMVMVIVVGVVAGPLYYSIATPITSMSADRILMVVAAVCLAMAWRAGRLELPKAVRLDWVLLALVGWLFVRAIGTNAPPEDSPPMTRWLTFIAMPFALYAMVRVTPLSPQSVRHIMNALLAMGAYLSVIGMLEVSGAHGLVYPRYIIDPTNWEFLGRARGPLLNPTANGVLLTTTLAIASHRWLASKGRGRVGYLLLIGLIGSGVVLTLTRSVWLGAFGLAAALGTLYVPRWLRVLCIASCVIIGGMAVMGDNSGLLAMKRDKALSAADAAKSVKLRPLLAIVAFEMWKDKPILGHGFGGYFDAAPPYHNIRSYDRQLNDVRPYMQHNFLTSIAVDTGLIGLSLIVTWLAIVACLAWRLMGTPDLTLAHRSVGVMTVGVLMGYIVNGMFHDVSAMPMLNNLLLFAGAMTANLTYQSDHLAVATPRSNRRAADARPQTAPSPTLEPA